MRKLFTTLTAGLLAVSFAATADAATKTSMKKKHTSLETSCKAQAAKKYSAVHFMKRRDYVKRCMGEAKA